MMTLPQHDAGLPLYDKYAVRTGYRYKQRRKRDLCFLHTGNGTGAAVSELYAFEIVDNQMEPYYVDINDLADRPGDRIAISYDAGKNAAAIFADDEKMLTDDLTSIGTADSESAVPDSFYCGDQISYTLDGDSIKVLFLPVLSSQAQPGVRFYLENSPFLESDLLFNYNKNGVITSFDLG